MTQSNSQTIEHNGQVVFFRVSPCSWMYKNYGLQVGVSLTDGAVNAETEFLNDKQFEASDKPKEQLVEAARTLVEKWLSENGTSSLQQKVQDWIKSKASLEAMLEKEEKRAVAAQKRADTRYKAKGYTHRVNACIHAASGDDRMSVSYVAGVPTDKDIAKIMRLSQVKTDYTVTAL